MPELPSGKFYTVKEGKGKHMLSALRIAGNDTGKIYFALIAQLIEIDGNPIVCEDLEEMSLRDVNVLMKEVGLENF